MRPAPVLLLPPALQSALLPIPPLSGTAIAVSLHPGLFTRRGKLQTEGQPVHAAAFLRERCVLLEQELLARPEELLRILLHEVAHFGWTRLGNSARWSWESLLRQELFHRARGETGWSANWRKTALRPDDPVARTRRWREYACESFADTYAWHKRGGRAHPETTLAPRWLRARSHWMSCWLPPVLPV